MEERPSLSFERKIRLDYSPVHGKGVFATEDIEPGDLIERCPMKVMGFRMKYHKDPVIWSYMFTNTCPCEECKRHGGHFLMVMGYGQIYNHQEDNNASISFDLKNEVADIKCLKKIAKGEEIFVSYGPNYFKNRERVDVAKKTNPSQSVFEQASEQPNSCTTQVFKPL
ncbi:SET domain-containing protein-lysine N-methyltransferase [bacterium]|nr:SET domain-containing protein-lysine N-methyltransferase [bacterium]